MTQEYNLEAAEKLVSELRDNFPAEPTEADHSLIARGLLLVAELHRIRFEDIYEQATRAARRKLGQKIDAAAEEGLKHTEAMGETSEAYRLRSDLYGLMIRTKYQGTKFLNEMEEYAAKAVELDPKNARAYVSVAKPYLFAKENQGGDLAKAFELLQKAVELDPKLVVARLFLAVAYDKKGDTAHAEEMLKRILDENPYCKPALKALEGAKKEPIKDPSRP